VDCPQMGWEVYARKESFYNSSGIVLAANASKLVIKAKEGDKTAPPGTPLYFALDNFLRNTVDLDNKIEASADLLKDEPSAINEILTEVNKRPAAGYLEGLQATIIGIKANEAVLTGKRVELNPKLYELG